MSPAGFRQTGPRFKPLHLPGLPQKATPMLTLGRCAVSSMAELKQHPGFVRKINGISKLLEMERNVWISYSNLAGCSRPRKYQICCQFFLSARDWGTFFTPDLQPGTLGVLPSLAEDYTMPVTAAHLATKCLHL